MAFKLCLSPNQTAKATALDVGNRFTDLGYFSCQSWLWGHFLQRSEGLGEDGGLRGRRSAAGPLGTDKLQVRDGQVDCFHLYLLLSPSLPQLLSLPPCSLSLPLKYILLMLRQDYRALSIPWQFMESYGSLFFFCNRKKGLSFPYTLCSFSSSDYKGRKWSVFL